MDNNPSYIIGPFIVQKICHRKVVKPIFSRMPHQCWSNKYNYCNIKQQWSLIDNLFKKLFSNPIYIISCKFSTRAIKIINVILSKVQQDSLIWSEFVSSKTSQVTDNRPHTYTGSLHGTSLIYSLTVKLHTLISDQTNSIQLLFVVVLSLEFANVLFIVTFWNP